MSIYFLFFLILDTDFYSADLFSWISEDKSLTHWTDSTKSSGIGAGLDDVQYFEVCEIEDKYFSL